LGVRELGSHLDPSIEKVVFTAGVDSGGGEGRYLPRVMVSLQYKGTILYAQILTGVCIGLIFIVDLARRPYVRAPVVEIEA
jgi:Flp pilus assembly protein protease CpaA